MRMARETPKHRNINTNNQCLLLTLTELKNHFFRKYTKKLTHCDDIILLFIEIIWQTWASH